MKWFRLCSRVINNRNLQHPFYRIIQNNNKRCFSLGRVVMSEENDNNNKDIRPVSQRRLKKLALREARERLGADTEQISPEAVREETVKEFEDYSNQTSKETVYPNHDDVDFPSDRADANRQQSRLSYRPKVDPASTSILLFPGQGSQFVGMGAGLLAYPDVLELYKVASDVTGIDLLKLCLNGPKSQLDKTLYCQLTVFITSLAAVEKLRDTYPRLIENCVATAGFSVGEYAALVFAGALSLEDALKVLKVRAEEMQNASELVSSGMISVITGRESKLGFGMLAAKEYCQKHHGIADPVCSVANYLCPEVKVIGGNVQALDFLQEHARELNLRRIKPLPVSGAFHTPLMLSAVKPVVNALSQVTIDKPLIPVHSNVTGTIYNSAEMIKKLLPKQIVKPVKWEQIMHIVYSRPKGENFPISVELGPGKQLGVILKQVNAAAFQEYRNISVASAEEDFARKSA